MTEKNHAVLGCLMNLMERYRIFVNLHSNDPNSTILRPFDPAEFRLYPMDTRPGGERVANLERMPIMVSLGHSHASSDGIAGSQQRAEVHAIGNPKWSYHQMIRARNRRTAANGIWIRAPVPAAQGVRKQSRWVTDGVFMGIGLLGVRGPSLVRTRDYSSRSYPINGHEHGALFQ